MRKLIRPDLGELKNASPRGVRRKQSPPEQTNAEEFYYLKQMAAKTAMIVVLNDGEELSGWIEWYDKGAIKLNRNDGPNLLIPKRSIRYLYKEEELRRSRRPRAAVARTRATAAAAGTPSAVTAAPSAGTSAAAAEEESKGE